MPYKTIWVEPEVFLEHNGVTVYHTYRDDDFDQGANWYWFTLREDGDEDKGAFDIRDLDTDKLLDHPPPYWNGTEWDSATPQERDAIMEAWNKWYESGFDEARQAVLKHAIDNGLLKALKPNEEAQQLTPLQAQVADHYQGGEFGHIETQGDAQNVGDGLFTFCINEAGDAGDKPELINMLNHAIHQLRSLVGELES